MTDCPTGLLVDICSDSPPKVEPRESFEDFLSTLGVSYTVSNGSVVLNARHLETAQKRKSTTSISEDDFITNEKFDFKLPSLEDIELPEIAMKDEEPADCASNVLADVVFQFPLLSMNVSPAKLGWNSEVSVEARKVSKRISFITSLEDYKDEKPTLVPLHQHLSKHDSTNDKENMAKLANESPPFVPNPDPVEALTPTGVKKIQGPDWRRGTFTLDNSFATPKSKPKLIMPSSTGSRRASSATRMTPVPKAQLTPKMVPRSRSFVNTPEVTSKISSFRKAPSPQVAHHPRPVSNLSFSGPRTPSLDRSTPGQNRLDRPQFQPHKVGGPSPLLRRALVPSLGSRVPPSSTLNTSKMRGPLKAAPVTMQRNQTTGTSASSAATSRLLQPSKLSANRSMLANKKTY